MQELAEDLARKVNPPFSILLKGEIGAGKTTFSQFFIKSLLINKDQPISSPTFNIVQIYETTKGPLWHVDLYRVKKESEIFELGVLEAMHECVCLIEWPDLLQNYLTNCNVKVIDL